MNMTLKNAYNNPFFSYICIDIYSHVVWEENLQECFIMVDIIRTQNVHNHVHILGYSQPLWKVNLSFEIGI
mgnify:CR=1 FL=1